MVKNCIEWRKTVLGVGIDEILQENGSLWSECFRCENDSSSFRYRRSTPERTDVFKHWPMWYHKVRCIFYFHSNFNSCYILDGQGMLYPGLSPCAMSNQPESSVVRSIFKVLGSIDMTALNKVITPERHWEAVVCTAESLVREVLPASSYATGHIVDNCLIIVDLKGFGCVVLFSSSILFIAE